MTYKLGLNDIMKIISYLQNDFNINTLKMYRVQGYTKKVLDGRMPINLPKSNLPNKQTKPNKRNNQKTNK